MEKEAGTEAEERGMSSGRVRVVIGEKVRVWEPVMRVRWTLRESPTDRRVRPSGEMEARWKWHIIQS